MIKYLGIDMGGTNIKTVLVDAEGKKLADDTRPTRDGEHENGIPAWQDSVRNIVKEFEETHGELAGVGMASPGMVAKDGRSMASMPGRLIGIEGHDWTDFLGREEKVPLLNDAHAALMGEYWIGAAKKYEDVFLLTLGTGVGGAIISSGKLLKGHLGRGGHLGHITVDAHGERNQTNMPGSIEWAISESTVKKRCGGKFETTKDLADAVRDGDEYASEVWHESVYKLAVACSSMINAVDPEAIIVGGGIAKAGDLLFKPLAEAMNKVEWRPNGFQVKFIPPELDDWAGAYGSAYQAKLIHEGIEK